MPAAWRAYASGQEGTASEARLAYWQDFLATGESDGTDKEHKALSTRLFHEASSLSSQEERLALARCLRRLSRTKAGAQPWGTEKGLRLLFSVQGELDLTPANALAIEVLRAFSNVLQHFHERADLLSHLYMDTLMRIVRDPSFEASAEDPDAFAFPVLLTLSYVTGGPVFAALPREEQCTVLPPILRLLREHGPPPGTAADTWHPVKFYGALMCTASYLLRSEPTDTGDLHALAFRAILCEAPQTPFPVSSLSGAAVQILALLPAPETPDVEPGLLFDLGRKLAQFVLTIVEEYMLRGDPLTKPLQRDGVFVSLETLLLPLCVQLLRMLEAVKDLRPIVEAMFCVQEPPPFYKPYENTLEADGLAHRGLFPRTIEIPRFMCSQSMPMTAMVFAFCMFAISDEIVELFVARFGFEACAGVLVSKMSDEDFEKFSESLERDPEQQRPIAEVRVYNDDDEMAPSDAMSPDELLSRLQRLQELGVEHQNPLEIASQLGLLDHIEKKIEAEERAEADRDLADAEAQVARLHLRSS